MVIASPYPDVDIPDVSLHEFIFSDLADRADRAALVDGTSGAQLTYRELDGLVAKIAAALAERGIGKGDEVAMFAPNTPYYAAVFHGILRAGGIVTTINSLYTPD